MDHRFTSADPFFTVSWLLGIRPPNNHDRGRDSPEKKAVVDGGDPGQRPLEPPVSSNNPDSPSPPPPPPPPSSSSSPKPTLSLTDISGEVRTDTTTPDGDDKKDDGETEGQKEEQAKPETKPEEGSTAQHGVQGNAQADVDKSDKEAANDVKASVETTELGVLGAEAKAEAEAGAIVKNVEGATTKEGEAKSSEVRKPEANVGDANTEPKEADANAGEAQGGEPKEAGTQGKPVEESKQEKRRKRRKEKKEAKKAKEKEERKAQRAKERADRTGGDEMDDQSEEEEKEEWEKEAEQEEERKRQKREEKKKRKEEKKRAEAKKATAKTLGENDKPPGVFRPQPVPPPEDPVTEAATHEAFMQFCKRIEPFVDELDDDNSWETQTIDGLSPEDVEDHSPSRLEWVRQIQSEGARNRALDRLMSLPGLEIAKEFVLRSVVRVEASRRRAEVVAVALRAKESAALKVRLQEEADAKAKADATAKAKAEARSKRQAEKARAAAEARKNMEAGVGAGAEARAEAENDGKTDGPDDDKGATEGAEGAEGADHPKGDITTRPDGLENAEADANTDANDDDPLPDDLTTELTAENRSPEKENPREPAATHDRLGGAEGAEGTESTESTESTEGAAGSSPTTASSGPPSTATIAAESGSETASNGTPSPPAAPPASPSPDAEPDAQTSGFYAAGQCPSPSDQPSSPVMEPASAMVPPVPEMVPAAAQDRPLVPLPVPASVGESSPPTDAVPFVHATSFPAGKPDVSHKHLSPGEASGNCGPSAHIQTPASAMAPAVDLSVDLDGDATGLLPGHASHLVVLGAIGTGKTTVAHLYARAMAYAASDRTKDLTSGLVFQSGPALRRVNRWEFALYSEIKVRTEQHGGCIVVIDDAHSLRNRYRDFHWLWTESQKLSSSITWVLAGSDRTMQLYDHYPFITASFSTIKLPNLNEAAFRGVLAAMFRARKSPMRFEGGFDGPYVRALTHRLGRAAEGRTGSTNIWTLVEALNQVSRRQAMRLHSARAAGQTPDDHLLTREDVTGGHRELTPEACPEWKELLGMIGLDEVKMAVRALAAQMEENEAREMRGQKPLLTTPNRVFLGNPGTGKTTVARLYGRILAFLGVLSKGDLLMRNASDLLDQFIGASERNTKAVLAEAHGNVLVIDDAYMLDPGSRADGMSTGKNGDYRSGVLDVLVAEVPNAPGEDRCVILAGYRAQMEAMFQNANPGLQRRFPIQEAFEFRDYTQDELGKILDLKMAREGLRCSEEARKVAMEVLRRAKDRPNFANGAEVDNLLSKAKLGRNKRAAELKEEEAKAKAARASVTPAPLPDRTDDRKPDGPTAHKTAETSEIRQNNYCDLPLLPQDFDPNHDRVSHAAQNCRALFSSFVGFDAIVQQFSSYQRMAAAMRTRDLDPRPYIPFTFIFRGPPGTGKTTTARKLGRIFYDMGLLAAADVVECSASDLVGEFCGQTGPKVMRLLESALGKVLFVDEAYRLADQEGGNFQREAVGELVDAVTKERFARKVVVVLAGYADDMDRLLKSNAGLRSRFATSVTFPAMTPEQCAALLRRGCVDAGIFVESLADMDSETRPRVIRAWERLVKTEGWGGGRSVEGLVGQVVTKVFERSDSNHGKNHGKNHGVYWIPLCGRATHVVKDRTMLFVQGNEVLSLLEAALLAGAAPGGRGQQNAGGDVRGTVMSNMTRVRGPNGS